MTAGAMLHVGVGDKETGETAVYQLHDAAGGLLYVGMSRNPMGRWAWHAELHPWWPDVASFTVKWYGSRDEAARMERDAIKDGAARHNIHSTPRHGAATGAGVRRALEVQRAGGPEEGRQALEEARRRLGQ
jgi:hypothetical protein